MCENEKTGIKENVQFSSLRWKISSLISWFFFPFSAEFDGKSKLFLIRQVVKKS
jgi:hypothetical protein